VAQARDETQARALREGAQQLGIALSDDAIGALLRFLDLIYDWNRSAGLTSVARDDAIRLHLLDSLSISRFLRDRHAIADLGSGAGLPGIPLAVSLPDARITLVESRRRKCSFLLEAIRALGLSNVIVVRRDARSLTPAELRVDAVVARAFLRPVDLVDLASGLLRSRGRIVIMGSRRANELDSVSADRRDVVLVDDAVFTLPGGSERRRVVVLEKREADAGAHRP
jgi:16S rRNA (guanine527-N7)-methyltransferase